MLASPARMGSTPGRQTPQGISRKRVMIGKARIPALDLSLVWGWGMAPLPFAFYKVSFRQQKAAA